MAMPFVRDFLENLISPFRQPLLLGMLLRKLGNIPARFSSPHPPTTSTKLTNFGNLFTKLPMSNSKEAVTKCKFFNGSHHGGKCPAYRKSCLSCNRKNHFKVCCPGNRKKVHEMEQVESGSEESSNLEFFAEQLVSRTLLI